MRFIKKTRTAAEVIAEARAALGSIAQAAADKSVALDDAIAALATQRSVVEREVDLAVRADRALSNQEE